MTPPYAVLLVSHNLEAGGSERQLTEVARHLDRRLFEPHVCCFRTGGLRERELHDAGVPICHLPLTSFHKPSVLASLRLFGAYLERSRIQLVHPFDVPGVLFAVPASRFFRVPVLSSQRVLRSLCSPYHRHLLRITDRMVDGIVVNSATVGHLLAEEDKVPPQSVHLCYNGIDTAVFRPGPRRLDGPGLVVGTLARFRKEKDQALLLEAFGRIRRRRGDLRLRLVGGGELEQDLRRRAAGLGLEDCCSIEPATACAAGVLQALDIFVLPSRSEALSNSLMEAMACECCAIATNVGGNPELIAHGETGLLFSPGRCDELAAHLDRVIEDGALRRRLAAAGARFVAERFTVKASVANMAAIYLAALSHNQPRAR